MVYDFSRIHEGVMDCNLSSCPFRLKDKGGCALSNRPTDQRELSGGGRNRNSLIVESLEIGRALADHGRAKFRAQGSCMYPCVQPGDTLHIESRLIEDIMVGDIAVVRHNGFLFGHRTIAKGEDKDGPYIVTRPDRSNHSNDGPTHKENILGVVNGIERRGKKASTNPKPLSFCEKARVSLWEWWNWDARLRMSERLERVQRLRLYTSIASPCLKALHPQLRYEVRAPLKPGQTHDLYRVFPPDQFDISQPLQQGKPAIEWTLLLYLNTTRTPAACITMIRSPEECPRGKGWHIEDLWVRIRYRGAGLDKALVGKAADILARSGTAIGLEV
jgi:hypothetical protein